MISVIIFSDSVNSHLFSYFVSTQVNRNWFTNLLTRQFSELFFPRIIEKSDVNDEFKTSGKIMLQRHKKCSESIIQIDWMTNYEP